MRRGCSKERDCGIFEIYLYASREARTSHCQLWAAGDGNLHIYLCRDDLSEEEFARRLDLAFNDLYQQASLVGGLVSGEHGIGFAKKQYMEKTLGETQIKLMQGIKDFFDPLHILNPGKIVY